MTSVSCDSIDSNDEGYFIVAEINNIIQVSLDGSRSQILVSNLSTAVAIDYDYR